MNTKYISLNEETVLNWMERHFDEYNSFKFKGATELIHHRLSEAGFSIFSTESFKTNAFNYVVVDFDKYERAKEKYDLHQYI